MDGGGEVALLLQQWSQSCGLGQMKVAGRPQESIALATAGF